MSTAAEVYESVASGLAAAREPDLSSFGPGEVRAAMAAALTSPCARDAFLVWLKERVQDLSDGRVRLEDRTDGAGPLEVPLGLLVAGEAFSEPVVLRGDADAPLAYPMRGA